ncbi:MAG TPA: hypothetical protein VHY09_07315 [Candidatus Methylacidiphilales bacterium]|jgi:hypothetical protein|nr:hypothetical protein [Candidatus Methylacidiphilales bacterium]
MGPPHDERDLYNPIDRSASQEEKAKHLHELSKANEPLVREAVAQIDSDLKTQSKVSLKKLENILAKARRPSILATKPWFDVEYVRDALRFKTAMDHFDQAIPIKSILASRQFETVKIDTEKMLLPKEWGWRFWGLDLRMRGGQLVEFYSPLKELDAPEVKDANHELFENWRGKSSEEINATRESFQAYRTDVMASFDRYDAAYQAALIRMGFSRPADAGTEADEEAAAVAWQDVAAQL